MKNIIVFYHILSIKWRKFAYIILKEHYDCICLPWLISTSYPLKWYWSRDYVDITIHNTEQDFLMFKYMINIIWYGSFRITSRINPRPISSLELKLSGWYWCLRLIQDVIRKEPYNTLYVFYFYYITFL